MDAQEETIEVPVPASLVYPKKLMGLTVSLWGMTAFSAVGSAALAILVVPSMSVFVAVLVGVGVVLYGVFFSLTMRDPFVWTRILEWVQVLAWRPSGDGFVGGRGKRYVP